MTIDSMQNYDEDEDEDKDILEDLELELLNSCLNPRVLEYEKRRLEEFKKTLKGTDRNLTNDSNENGGVVHFAQNDSEVLHWTTHYPLVIIHFHHPNFEKCKIIDDHLKKLASRFPLIRWCKANVMECPFLVGKLKIKVLPRLDIFKNGIKIDSVVGFENIHGHETCTTDELLNRIFSSGILENLHGLKVNRKSKRISSVGECEMDELDQY